MASIFGKDPSQEPGQSAYARERIEKEIEHLKKPKSTRQGADERKTLGIFVCSVIALVLFGLYAMDPFLFSWYKGDAIKDYLYLHNYDTGQKAQALATCGILTPADVQILNQRQGSFQDYYPSLQEADKNADSIIGFMNGLSKLRNGPPDDLDALGKIRYNLFCKWGVIPPKEWSALNPVIKDE
jgi:hypothetical protein